VFEPNKHSKDDVRVMTLLMKMMIIEDHQSFEWEIIFYSMKVDIMVVHIN